MHMNYSQIMSPRPPLPRKVGGHDPPAPMGAPPLPGGATVTCHTFLKALFTSVSE